MHDPDHEAAGLPGGYPLALLSTLGPVAELRWNSRTGRVALIDVDLDAIHLGQPIEAGCRQGASRCGGVAAGVAIRPNPIPHLDATRSDPRKQATSTDHLAGGDLP